MNSFIKYIPKSLDDHKAFVEHLLSIIDTKLQFVKHRTNALISSLSTSPIMENNSESDLIEYLSLDFGTLPSDQEAAFSLIEKYSKTTNLLLLLRAKLNEKNVSLIYDLLNNDRYLNYDHNALGIMLENSMI